MSTPQRKEIRVTNSKDSGDGSLREAIKKGNELVKASPSQPIEIVFSEGFHIKPLKGYQLEKGDWVFNKTKRMNIIIDGKNSVGPLFTIGSPENTLASKTVADIPELRVDAHRIHLINSHVKGGSGKNGGGGGLGAGAALLHWNGHVSWSNSSFQGNKVESGDADDLVKAGSEDDEAIGGKGDDVIFGEEGNDILNGGQGDDILSGGNDIDVVNGEEGNDQLYGGAGDDFIFGQNGNDLIAGGEGKDTLSGGIGSDSIYGGDGNNIFLPEKDNSIDKIIISADGIADAIYSLDWFDEIIIQGATSKDLEYAIVDDGIGIFVGGVLEATYFNAGTTLTTADLNNMTRAELV